MGKQCWSLSVSSNFLLFFLVIYRGSYQTPRNVFSSISNHHRWQHSEPESRTSSLLARLSRGKQVNFMVWFYECSTSNFSLQIIHRLSKQLTLTITGLHCAYQVLIVWEAWIHPNLNICYCKKRSHYVYREGLSFLQIQNIRGKGSGRVDEEWEIRWHSVNRYWQIYR